MALAAEEEPEPKDRIWVVYSETSQGEPQEAQGWVREPWKAPRIYSAFRTYKIGHPTYFHSNRLLSALGWPMMETLSLHAKAFFP